MASPYTHKKLSEVEDSAPKFGFAPNLQARFAAGDLGLERLGMSLQRYAPGFRSPFGHSHQSQEEVYVVVDGSGRIKLDDEIVELRQWDAVRIPSEVTRAIEGGPDGIEILAIGAPAVENMQEDVNMNPGWWSD